MTTFSRCLLLPVFALAGCSRQPAADSAALPAPDRPAVVVEPQSGAATGGEQAKPQSQPQSQLPEPAPTPPPAFNFPADRTGKALARVSEPKAPPALRTERFGKSPQPRAVPAKILEPDALPRIRPAPPPELLKLAAARPANPPEKIPVNFGAGADALAAKPVLPVAAVVTPRAPDASIPPPAPMLGQPAADRVAVDDPTNEAGNAAVVAESVKVALPPSGFLKVDVPDPFELGAQVKPKLPAAAEPSALPIPVNPPRVK